MEDIDDIPDLSISSLKTVNKKVLNTNVEIKSQKYALDYAIDNFKYLKSFVNFKLIPFEIIGFIAESIVKQSYKQDLSFYYKYDKDVSLYSQCIIISAINSYIKGNSGENDIIELVKGFELSEYLGSTFDEIIDQVLKNLLAFYFQ